MSPAGDETRWVSDLLANLSTPAMPPEVTARVNAAISEELGASVAPVSEFSRFRRLAQRPPAWLAAAAAAAIIGAIVVPVALHRHTTTHSTADKSSVSAPQPATGTSGGAGASSAKSAALNYTPDNLAFGVRSLLATQPSTLEATDSASQPTMPNTSMQLNTGARQPSSDCLSALERRASSPVLANEAVQWSSQPAYLVLFADRSNDKQVVAVVVSTSCTAANTHVLYEGRFAR